MHLHINHLNSLCQYFCSISGTFYFINTFDSNTLIQWLFSWRRNSDPVIQNYVNMLFHWLRYSKFICWFIVSSIKSNLCLGQRNIALYFKQRVSIHLNIYLTNILIICSHMFQIYQAEFIFNLIYISLHGANTKWGGALAETVPLTRGHFERIFSLKLQIC